jgi:hypothetical protein
MSVGVMKDEKLKLKNTLHFKKNKTSEHWKKVLGLRKERQLWKSSETKGVIQTVLEEDPTSVLEEYNLSIRS